MPIVPLTYTRVPNHPLNRINLTWRAWHLKFSNLQFPTNIQTTPPYFPSVNLNNSLTNSSHPVPTPSLNYPSRSSYPLPIPSYLTYPTPPQLPFLPPQATQKWLTQWLYRHLIYTSLCFTFDIHKATDTYVLISLYCINKKKEGGGMADANTFTPMIRTNKWNYSLYKIQMYCKFIHSSSHNNEVVTLQYAWLWVFSFTMCV